MKFLDFINRASYPLALTVIVSSAIFCGVMQWLTPFQMDDLAYGEPFKGALTGDAPGAGWQDGIDFIKWHWQEINGRLGDKLMLWVLTDIPKWMFACIAGLASMCIFLFGSRVAFGSIRTRPLCSIILTGMFTAFLPWAGYMFLTNMFLNYGLGSALSIIVLWLFVRTPKLPGSPLLLYPALFLLAMLSGGWHEAYSVPMLPAMVISMLIMRRQNPAMRWWLLAGTFAGLMLILSAPGFWIRLNGDPTHIFNEGYIIPGILKGLSILLLLPLFLILCACSGIRARMTRLTTALSIMGMVIIVGSLGIFLNSLYVVRVFWYADVLVMPVLALLGALMCGKMNVHIKQAVVVLSIAFMATHYAVCIYWQQLLSREHDEIVEAYRRSADGVVFHDFHGRYFGPVLALRKARIFAFSYDMRQYLTPFHRTDWAYLSLVPVELRSLTSEAFDAPCQMKFYRGYAVSNNPELLAKEPVQYFQFRSEQGKEMCLPTIVNPFFGKDGKQYFYLEPDERQAGGVKLVSVAAE